ncbi:MAG: hypothetical protein U9R08_04565, partial [Nanoarchaeota archaeon]|nr:hypothetical protein [Nanoarchaeota archaeon]
VDGDIVLDLNDFADLNATLVSPIIGYIELYNNGTLINAGLSPLNNYTEFNESGSYNITAYYPATENYTESFETHNIVVGGDIDEPEFIYISPDLDSSYNQTNLVELKTCVSESSTLTALLEWDLTSKLVTLVYNGTDYCYTYTFTNTTYAGDYAVTFNATDAFDNSNISTTNFTVVDITAPSVTDINPLNGAQFNYTDLVNINVNVTDYYFDNIDTVIANITYPDGTSQLITLSEIDNTQIFNNTFSDTTQIGQYTLTIYANDTSGNLNDTELVFFVVNDNVFPSADNPQPTAGTEYNQTDSVTLSINATDNDGIDTVLATITWDSTSETVELTYNAGTGLYDYTWTNTTYVDQYNITYFVNDTSGNVNDTESTYFNVNDVIEPAWSNLLTTPASPTTYAPSQSYEFNVTWTDNVGIEDIIFEWNSINYTYSNAQIAKTGDIYSITFIDLPVSVNSYTWYANDTAGNLNLTQTFTYTIQKATSEVNLLLNGTGADFYIAINDTVNITAYMITPSTGYIELYNNGTLINTGNDYLENITFFNESGIYNITVIYSGNENYTETSETHDVYVSMGDCPPTVILHAPEDNFITNLETINFNCSANDDYAITNITFYWNYSGTFSDDGIQIFGYAPAEAIFSKSVTQSTKIIWNCLTYDNATVPQQDWANTNFTLTVDLDEPVYSNINEYPLDSATYSPGQNYYFNITVTDNLEVSTVILEFAGINYTTTKTGDVYAVTIPNLAVDTYNYIWYMNDTAGNYNTTSSTYTVTPKTSVCLLSFTPVSGSNYTTQGVNASCSCNNLESGEKLYRDNLDVVSENNFYTPLAANTYNYVCNVTATNNYTAASNSSTYIINKEQSIVNLTLNTLDDDITVEVNDNVNVQATLELGESDILLYEDSILINQGLSPLDNITSYSTLSIHNLTVEYPETTNYTFSYDQHFVTVQDTYNPAWSNNISYPEPVTYAPGASYQFNVTWTDETTIDTVIIEHNFNGAFQNFTVPNLGDIYYYDFTDLAAGSYTWKMYANDTSGNLNVTDTFTYTVQKAATTVSLTLNTIQDNVTVTYPNTVTAVYSTNAATASMYRDSIDVTSELGVPRSLGVAVYNYTVINLGDENYTESSITYYATVQRATGTCSLSFNPVSPQTYPVSVTALCSCTNSETLTRNNLDATSEINVATLLGAGLHEYNCSSVETQNYTSAEDIDNYTIYKATSSIDLRLDGTGNNITVEVQTIVNHTASLINHSSGTAEIYINNIQEATGSSPLTKLYNYTTLGTYNVTAFYTATENYSDAHETHYVTVEDTIPPVIETITSAPDTNMVTTSETYNISATATDNYLIDSIVARITLPDGTITEHSLPVNYIPVQTGLHNYTIFVNDTSGNYVISEVKEFLVGTELIYQQYNLVNDTTGIPGTVNVHFSDTESLLHFHLMPGGFEADYHILDFLLDYEYIPDDGIASVYIMGINISVDNNQSLGYYRVVPAATDFIETIGLNTTYSTPQSYTITFSYNDTSYSNENNLAVYKCELWDFENRVCTGTWASIAATQNIADNYFTFTTTGFSGFSIKEEVATTPTTGGGGGGRACVENWQCSAWTPRYCPSSGVQTRDCYDYNNCRTYEYKPSESKTCIYIPEDTELIEDITSELSELVDTYDYTSGDSVIVTVVDLKGNTVPDAEVSVRKPSGDILNFITDSDGKLKFTSDEPGTWKLELIKSGYVGKLFNINIIAPEKLVPELEPVIEKPTSFNSLWLLLLLLIILAFLISHQFVNMATTKKRGKKEVKVVITNISRHWKRTAVDIKLHLKKGSKIRKLSVLNYKGVKIKKLNAKTFIFKNFKLAPGKRLVLSLVYVSTNIKLVSTYRWNSLPFFDLRASEERKTRKINNRARFNDMHAKHLAHRTKIKKHHEEIERLKYNAHRRRVRKYNNIKLSLRTLFILRPRKFITKKVHEFEKSQKISHAKFLKERRKHEKELARVHSIKVKKDSKFEKELKAIRENLKQSRITEKRNFTRKKNILKSSLNTSAKTFKRKNKSMLRDLDNALDEFIKDIRKAPKKFAKLFVKRKKVVKKYPHPKLNAKEIELIKHQIKKDIVVQVLTLKRAGKSYSTIFNKIVLQGYPDYLVKNCLDLVYKINNPKDKVFIKDDILFEVTAKNVKQR